jgi:hypothetical protein
VKASRDWMLERDKLRGSLAQLDASR